VICSGRGTCDGDGTLHGDGTCRCLPGSTGRLCELCLTNHVGSSCVPCPGMTLDGQACSGHGTCTGQGTRQGAGTCTCTAGWGGTTCSTPKPCSELNDCSGHGTCSEGGSGSVCFCDAGYEGGECATVTSIADQEAACGECNRLDELCIGGVCSNVAPPTDPCGTEDCSRHGMCADGSCVCDPSWTGNRCEIDRGIAHRWDATEWSVCTDDCGTTGKRERTVECVGNSDSSRVADSVCTAAFGASPDSFEPCHRFECGSVVTVVGLWLNMPHAYVNTTSLHTSTFEQSVEEELGAASNVPAARFHVVSSKSGGDSGTLTMVKFVVLPPTGVENDKEDAETVSSKLQDQSLDSTSRLRTQGTFVRRVLPKQGSLNYVAVTAQSRATNDAANAAVSSIEAIDPFVDVSSDVSGSTVASPSGVSSNSGLNHGGLAGVVVAASFLGIGAVVGLVWFGMHRTSAGSAYKDRKSSKKSTMKIQLTEAEKSEMGMVTNPNLSNAKTDEAIQLVQAAVAHDETRRFLQAIELYEKAVQKFKEVMKIEKNAQFKFSLAKRMDKYMTRIKELKQHLKKGGILSKPPRPSTNSRGGGGRGGRGGATKANGLVRAPQVARVEMKRQDI